MNRHRGIFFSWVSPSSIPEISSLLIFEYFRRKPPPEEHGAQGEWVKVRDGLQGAEHCIRVLTPEEFDEWHRCLEVPVQVAFGRRPVAFCSQEGRWWVIYEDMDESEVIAGFEECFEGQADETAPAGQGQSARDESANELSRFFGIAISMRREPRCRLLILPPVTWSSACSARTSATAWTATPPHGWRAWRNWSSGSRRFPNG